MQILERECDACGRRVRTAKEGDVCGACDLAMCKGCLEGTARCPSCQRAFGETRDAPAIAHAAPKSSSVPVGLLAVLAILIGITYVYFQGRGGDAPTGPPPDVLSVRERTEPGGWGVVGGAVDTCGRARTQSALVFERLSNMRFAPAGPDDLEWALRPVLGALHAHLRPSRADGVGPITRPLSGTSSAGDAGYELRFVVDQWADPVVGDGEASGGRVTGRLFVTGANGRVECAAAVDHSGDVVPAPREGSALGAARVALVIGALRSGVERTLPTRDIALPE